MQDLRYAFRLLLKNPAFSIVAILTLALGIGANSAIFSVVNAVILKPLPYPQSERLVQMWSQFPTMKFFEFPISPPEYFEMRKRNQFFEEMGGWVTGSANLTGDGEPLRLTVGYASFSLFPTLGIPARKGRFFSEEEDFPSADPVVMLSDGLWRQKFAGDPDMVGKDIMIDGLRTRVVGIMPPSFAFPSPEIQAWQPLGLDPANVGNRWGNHFIRICGRLKDGSSLQQARAQLQVLVQGFEAEAGPNQHRPSTQGHPFILNDLHEQTVGDVRPQMWLLLAAVGVVLLIACVNVAGLLLARAEARNREMAIRTALGAEGGRLMRQLLTESTLLALIGGILGMLVANWGVGALLSIDPQSVPRLQEIGLNWTVVSFTLGISLLTGLLFGLMPAFSMLRSDLHSPLKDGGRGASSGRARQNFRRILVAAEMALAVVLVIGSGLMIRSFVAMLGIDTGFRSDRLLLMRTELTQTDYPTDEQTIAFYQQVLQRLRTLPGVRSAAAVSSLPLRSRLNANDFRIEGRTRTPDGPPINVDYQQVFSPGYLETMGIRLLEGRSFSPEDRVGRAPVTIVSKSFVDRFWPGESALGKRIGAFGDRPWLEIVGVVDDVRQDTLVAPFKPHMYTPMAQNPDSRGFAFRAMDIVLRSDVSPLSLASAARAAIWDIDSHIPIADLQTMDDVLGSGLAERRFTVLLLGIFAATALMLATVGIYGVMSYAVTQRTQEIGVRMALGARRSDVMGLVVKQGMVLAAAGLAVGVAAAVALTRLLDEFLAGLLYQIGAFDPVTFLVVPLVLAAVALAACCIPARRATQVDPLTALHYE